MSVEEIEARQRQHALADICRAYGGACSDNGGCVSYFDAFLRDTWPRMQADALLRDAVGAVERRLAEQASAVEAAELSVEECRDALKRVEAARRELDDGVAAAVRAHLRSAHAASAFAREVAPEAASLFGDADKWGRLDKQEAKIKELMGDGVHAAWKRSASSGDAWGGLVTKRLLIYTSQAVDVIGAFQEWAADEAQRVQASALPALVPMVDAWARGRGLDVGVERGLLAAVMRREVEAMPTPVAPVERVDAADRGHWGVNTLAAAITMAPLAALGAANLGLTILRKATGEKSWGMGFSVSFVALLDVDFWSGLIDAAADHVLSAHTTAVVEALRVELSARAARYQARLADPAVAGDLARLQRECCVTEVLRLKLGDLLAASGAGLAAESPA